ncbi:MAG: DUF2939 domain-containing protein [Variibacter sp.]|nr:DUF2939 domain-containing protein [Variibacter sp.]
MRWSLRIAALLGALLAAYTLWPFLDLYRLGRAIERSDAAELATRVEMRALRPSISRQVLAAYLRLTGKDGDLPGFLGGAVAGFGAALADPALSDLIQFDQVAALMREALSRPAEHGRPRSIAELVPRDLGSLWTLYASSDYKLHDFYVSVPPAFAPDQRFRLRLHLTQWKWKLYEVELPEHLRTRLAEMLAREFKQK